MKKIVLTLLLFTFSAIHLLAQENPLGIFNRANELYQKGEFVKAIDTYGQLINQNKVNGKLYYNLANAYYKNQQMGFAVLYYEKALKLIPRDSDTRYNLELLNKMLKEQQPNFFEQIIQGLNGMASLNELTVITSSIFLFLVLLLSVFLFNRKKLILLFCGIIFIFLATFSTLLYIKLDREVFTNWAVVTQGPCDVRNGPGFENSVGFNLPEGKKVMILRQKDEWVAVGLKSEGLRGWLEKKYISSISE